MAAAAAVRPMEGQTIGIIGLTSDRWVLLSIRLSRSGTYKKPPRVLIRENLESRLSRSTHGNVGKSRICRFY